MSSQNNAIAILLSLVLQLSCGYVQYRSYYRPTYNVRRTAAQQQQQCTVETEKGAIRGIIIPSRSNVYVHSFFGVPYAQPPVGDKRWEYPVELEAWNGTLDGTKIKPRCSQVPAQNENGQFYATDEDCLYLNVFTPKLNANASLPVMVMIHGGGYVSGGADMFPAMGVVNNLASRGVVVVTLNYRLGAFGYLTAGDKQLPGNFGLMDIVMALKWVQNEINAFGGDANSVTLYGVSTGAHAASTVMLYPGVTDMVSQGILQSGSVLLPSSTNTTVAVDTSMEFTNQLGCGDWHASGAEKVLQCARNKTTFEVIAASTGDQMYWRPAASEEFINEQLKSGPKLNFLIGVNHDEHSLFLLPEKVRQMKQQSTDPYTNPYYASFTHDDLLSAINHTLSLYDLPVNSLAGKMAKLLYDDVSVNDVGNADHMHWYKQYVKLESDSIFFAPAYQEAAARAKNGGNVFLYSFDHVAINDRCKSPWRGVQHADDQQYLMSMPGTFGRGCGKFVANTADYQVADCFGKMITSFVKNGDPSTPSCLPIDWTPLKQQDNGETSAKYLSFNTSPSCCGVFAPRATYFWSEIAHMLNDMKPDSDQDYIYYKVHNNVRVLK